MNENNQGQRNPHGGRNPAVVIGLDSMQGLQTARILKGHGIPVIAIAADPDHHACRTNTCERILIADTGAESLLDMLDELARSFAGLAVLVPCQDKCVRVLSRGRDRLDSRYRYVLATAEVVEQLMDKESFVEFATRLGLPVPATRRIHDRTEALDAAADIPFPCMLKPAYRSARWDRHTKNKVFRVNDIEEFMRRYDQCSGWADTLIAQQWIEGGDDCLISCNCYFGRDGGGPLATFVARKLRQWPPEAGSSCLGEEIRDDTVLATTLTLFESVNYRGLGYLEMKRDARTGEYFVIEPNIGRPTGRSAIAEAGGVELLYTMYCDALGLPLPAERTQRYRGTKWIDLRHDLQSAAHYFRRGELGLRDWFSSIRGRKAYAVFSWRDPAPFLHDLKRAFSMALARRRRKSDEMSREPGDRTQAD
jgi:predicted ATP-grasp superfamily ATP-dependent carboligase